MQKAIILTYPRTGSNYLVSLLNSHPRIHFHGEIFNRERIATFRGRFEIENTFGVDLHRIRETDLTSFLDLAFSYPAGKRLHCRGFKFFVDHSRAALEHILADQRIGIIFLTRANLLASYSSQIIARKTGAWKAVGPIDTGTCELVVFDALEFKAYCNRLLREVADLQARLSGRPNVTFVEYTSLAKPERHQDLVRFLEEETRHTLVGTLDKQNPGCVIDRFGNKDLVIRFLEKLGRPEWAMTG